MSFDSPQCSLRGLRQWIHHIWLALQLSSTFNGLLPAINPCTVLQSTCSSQITVADWAEVLSGLEPLLPKRNVSTILALVGSLPKVLVFLAAHLAWWWISFLKLSCSWILAFPPDPSLLLHTTCSRTSSSYRRPARQKTVKNYLSLASKFHSFTTQTYITKKYEWSDQSNDCAQFKVLCRMKTTTVTSSSSHSSHVGNVLCIKKMKVFTWTSGLWFMICNHVHES